MWRSCLSVSLFVRPVATSSCSTLAGSGGSRSSQGPPDVDYVKRKPGIKAGLIDGQLMAQTIHKELAFEVKDMTSRGLHPPNLTVLLVGDNPSSKSYVKKKSEAAVKVGMTGHIIHKPATISQSELLDLVNDLNNDDTVDGLLVQLPLPDHINEGTVCQAIDPHKDVDGFHHVNIGRYVMGRPAFIPATPLGVLEMLKRCKVETFGKTACIVGRSKHIGFTLNTLLHSDGYGSGDLIIGADATVILCHRYTPQDELKRMTSASDIVITGTGVPGLIRGDMIKEGATVIDIGITRVTDVKGKSRLVGDVLFSEVAKVASLITPVPGGVGPMTVAMVLKNTLMAANGKYKDTDIKAHLS